MNSELCSVLAIAAQPALSSKHSTGRGFGGGDGERSRGTYAGFRGKHVLGVPNGGGGAVGTGLW